MNILTINNPSDLEILRQKSTKIESKEELIELLPILREMKNYLKPINQGEKSNGLGLALPQVGVLKCGFIMKRENENYQIIINPKILSNSQQNIKNNKREYIEGCLSDLGSEYIVTRYKFINVVYRDENFKLKTELLSGLDAEVFQHELNHLEGILISDIGVKIK